VAKLDPETAAHHAADGAAITLARLAGLRGELWTLHKQLVVLAEYIDAHEDRGGDSDALAHAIGMGALCARMLAQQGAEHVRTLASRLPLRGLDYEEVPPE